MKVLSILPQSVFNSVQDWGRSRERRLSILPQSMFNMLFFALVSVVEQPFQSYLSPCLTRHVRWVIRDDTHELSILPQSVFNILRKAWVSDKISFLSILPQSVFNNVMLFAYSSFRCLSILPQSVFNRRREHCVLCVVLLSILPQSVFNKNQAKKRGEGYRDFQSYLSPCLTVNTPLL